MDAIAKRNEREATRAKKAGQLTYRHEVVDTWPACVECQQPIRHRGLGGADRSCGCPGVRWRSRITGPAWERVESEGAKAGRQAAEAALAAALGRSTDGGDQW